jgi:hypothetical protein
MTVYNSSGNHYHKDEESTGGMITVNLVVRGKAVYNVILRESLAQGRGIYRRSGYFFVNSQLKEEEATGGMIF